jgi:hypothetical protein
MIPEDFYGRKPFVWWTAIVEDIQDPLNTGAVRVRIIGIHSLDKSQVPTSSLPWAQICKPTTGTNTSSGLRYGDWVTGFFQDGEQGQIPVVTGVYGGIESKQSQTVYREASIRVGAPNLPTSTQTYRKVGEPTTAPIARGVIKGTLVDKTNGQLEHVCDISPYVKQSVDWIKTQFSVIVEAIRKGIRALLIALGFDPSGESSKLMNTLKAIAAEVKKFKGYIDEFNTAIGNLLKYVAQLRAMIDYILSLPERILALFQECLTKIYAALAAGFASLFTEIDVDLLKGEGVNVAEITREFNTLVADTQALYNSTLTAISLPGQIANTLLTPASPADVNKAGNDLSKFFSTQTSEGVASTTAQYTTSIDPGKQP